MTPDLDSISSAVAYAYLSSHLTSPTPSTYHYLPLIQTAREDLHLRPENIAALASSNIVDNQTLFTLDDLPHDSDSKGVAGYALVDHNRLGQRFGGVDGNVVAIIDHHVNESAHLNASPRQISLVGSCASLVTEYFSTLVSSSIWPKELADLLLSTILIDTSLKPLPKGKATEVDIASVKFLIPHSSIAGNLNALVALEEMNTVLLETKMNVGGMSGRDLLRRDYKQYSFATTAGADAGASADADGGATTTIQYGLATVPLSFEDWLVKSKTWDAIVVEAKEWITAQKLDFLGILTTYNLVKKDGSKGKHARQLMMVVDAPATLGLDQLIKTIEGNEELQLKGIESGVGWQCWIQGNEKATRKQVAPIVHTTLEGMFGKVSST